MMSALSLDDWNQQVLMLVQALFGAVSRNFRMVTLGHNGEKWILSFALEEESAEDRAEIDDVGSEFAALQVTAIDLEIEVWVTREPLPWPAPPTRVVFRRRESS